MKFTIIFSVFFMLLSGNYSIYARFFDALSSGGKSIPPIEGASRDENTSSKQTVINGGADLENIQYSGLTVNGSLDFLNLVVDKTLKVNGSADGKYLKARSVIINGSGNCDYVETYTLTVNGSFSGKNIKTQSIEVTGATEISEVTADILTAAGDVAIENGVIGKVRGVSNRRQTLILKGTSRVTGDVTLNSNQGIVILEDSAEILGRVHGGTIKRA